MGSEDSQVLEKDMKKTNRTTKLITGAILLLFCGLIYAWSLFRGFFQEAFPIWTIGNLSMTFTISMVFFCIGGFISGRLLPKFGAKVMILLSAIFLLIGFMGVSLLNTNSPKTSLVTLYIFYGVISGTGIGFSYNAILATVGKMFPDRQGFASGVMMMGFGLGGLLLGAIVTNIINNIGIFNVFRILAVLMFMVLFIGSRIIGKGLHEAPFRAPQTEGVANGVNIKASAPKKSNDGKEESKIKTENTGELTTKEMLTTASFWIFIIWNVVTNSAGLMVLNSAAPIVAQFGAPAILGMIVSLCNGGGRPIFGGIFDRLGRSKTMIIDCALQIGSGVFLTLGAITKNVPLIILGLIAAGFFYSGSPTIAAAFINKEYGSKNYSSNFSTANFSLIPAAFIGPSLSSALISASGGAYTGTFIAIIVCGVISIATLPVLAKFVKRN